MLFINFSGPDCCGKTTQADLLAKRVSRTGAQVLRLNSPTNGLGGYAARKTLQANLPWSTISDDPLLPAILRQCTIVADRYAAVPEIQETLRKGGFVITCRWKPSGEIYGSADGIGTDWITAVQSSLPDADLNILLDFEPEVFVQRVSARGRTPECYESLMFQKQIIKRYRDFWGGQAKSRPGRWISIDGSRPSAEIHERVFEIVRAESIARSLGI